jgi:hypothetical protein
MKLELGTGNHPTPYYLHHDKWKHSPHIDVTHDLERLPWPWEDSSVEVLLATDVFEHLRLEVQEWMDECWRILIPGGTLSMRLPAFDNPYSWRDPTHRRVFHKESFLYWCPQAAGTVWQDFGRYYFGEGYTKWWQQISVMTECKDLRVILQKMF